MYCTVLYCTVVQVVLMRTNPEVTNNHLIVCLGEDTPPVWAGTHPPCEGSVL